MYKYRVTQAFNNNPTLTILPTPNTTTTKHQPTTTITQNKQTTNNTPQHTTNHNTTTTTQNNKQYISQVSQEIQHIAQNNFFNNH